MIPDLDNLLLMSKQQANRIDAFKTIVEEQELEIERLETRVNEVASESLKFKRNVILGAEGGGICLGTVGTIGGVALTVLTGPLGLILLVPMGIGTIVSSVFTGIDGNKETKVKQILEANPELHYHQAYELMEKEKLVIKSKYSTSTYTCVHSAFSVTTEREDKFVMEGIEGEIQ